mgnify:CR=1 FL=1
MESIRVVLCTCPDERVASELATGLVESRLAACVNVLPRIRSIYRWQGDVQDEAESLMVIKTGETRVTALQGWLVEAATNYQVVPHNGRIIGGEFERGHHRGGGQ